MEYLFKIVQKLPFPYTNEFADLRGVTNHFQELLFVVACLQLQIVAVTVFC